MILESQSVDRIQSSSEANTRKHNSETTTGNEEAKKAQASEAKVVAHTQAGARCCQQTLRRVREVFDSK